MKMKKMGFYRGMRGKVCSVILSSILISLCMIVSVIAAPGGWGGGGGWGGWGGGGGQGGNSNLDTSVGSKTRNNILSFENKKVEEGVPLKVEGAPSNSKFNWTIKSADGTEKTVATETGSYTPTKDDMEKLITVTLEGNEDATACIYFSSLPVIYINNKTGYYAVNEEYTDAVMDVQPDEAKTDENTLYTGDIQIRLRGNSTQYRDKRPFNIKLDTKSDLFGMGASKHWVLLANDIDHTLMRNKLLYDFSGAIGMETFMDSLNVVVIFNDRYYGVYQLCEQVNVEPERVDIYDWEESAEDAAKAIVDQQVSDGTLTEEEGSSQKANLEDAMCQNMSWITSPYEFTYDVDKDGEKETYKITDYIDIPAATGGVLVETDFYAFDGANPSTMITAYSEPMYIKTPEFGISNDTLFQYTKNYLQSFEYALHSTDFVYHDNDVHYTAKNKKGGSGNSGYTATDYSDSERDGMHYSQLFDMDSLVQNFIVCEFSMNWDSMKNSKFIYKDIDGLFKIGPEWDFDWALGNINMYDINTWYPTSWHTTEPAFVVEQYYQTVQWDRCLIRDPYFITRVYEKYKEIRETVIEDMIKDGGTIDTYSAYLSDAAAANDDKWSYSYDQYRSVGFDDSMNNMVKFIDTRVDWLDEQFASLDTLIDSLGYYKTSDKLKVAGIDTQSQDGYTQITAEVTDPAITAISFQVNGTEELSADVVSGQAVCKVPDSALVANAEQLNVVQIRGIGQDGKWIIENKEEGNYYNAVSNYAVFNSDSKVIETVGTADTVKDDSDTVVKTSTEKQTDGSYSAALIVTLLGSLAVYLTVRLRR